MEQDPLVPAESLYGPPRDVHDLGRLRAALGEDRERRQHQLRSCPSAGTSARGSARSSSTRGGRPRRSPAAGRPARSSGRSAPGSGGTRAGGPGCRTRTLRRRAPPRRSAAPPSPTAGRRRTRPARSWSPTGSRGAPRACRRSGRGTWWPRRTPRAGTPGGDMPRRRRVPLARRRGRAGSSRAGPEAGQAPGRTRRSSRPELDREPGVLLVPVGRHMPRSHARSPWLRVRAPTVRGSDCVPDEAGVRFVRHRCECDRRSERR